MQTRELKVKRLFTSQHMAGCYPLLTSLHLDPCMAAMRSTFQCFIVTLTGVLFVLCFLLSFLDDTVEAQKSIAFIMNHK